jgi:hypothetical protein
MPKRVAAHGRGEACEKVEGDVEVRSRLESQKSASLFLFISFFCS